MTCNMSCLAVKVDIRIHTSPDVKYYPEKGREGSEGGRSEIDGEREGGRERGERERERERKRERETERETE